jgi:lipopolysaccharide export system protein LptA
MKAQTGAEFFVVFSCVALVLLILVVISAGQATNLLHSKNILSAKKTAYEIASIINNAYLAGDGAEYVTWVDSNNEIISISGNNVIVEKNGEKASASLLTANINTTEIVAGYQKIKNNAGLIEVE